MTVGTDILNGGTASEARNFAHGFDASEATFAGIFNDVIPIFAAHNLKFIWGKFVDSAHAVDNNYTIKAFVVTEGVGAVAEDKSREMVLSGEAVGFGKVFGTFDFDDISSGTTKTHGGKTGYKNVFIDSHMSIIAYLLGPMVMV